MRDRSQNDESESLDDIFSSIICEAIMSDYA